MKKLILLIVFIPFLYLLTGCSQDGENPLCPTGYTGIGCATERTPTSIDINGLTVDFFPAYKASGSDWDLWDSPDLFIKVFSGTGNLLYTSGVYQNTYHSNDHYFDFFNSLRPPNQYKIELYDADVSVNDYIGSATLKHKKGDGFPKQLEIGGSRGISIELDVDYNFD